jgi:hypothetical protein
VQGGGRGGGCLGLQARDDLPCFPDPPGRERAGVKSSCPVSWASRFASSAQDTARSQSPITATMGRLGEPGYRSSARNRLGSGGMMRPAGDCPAVARAGEMMAACRRRTTSR